MSLPHYSKLGSPMSPRGALFIIHDQEGVIQANVDIYKSYLEAMGIKITPEVERYIFTYCCKQQEEFDRQTALEGISDSVITLFSFKKKRETVKFCRGIAVTEHELFLLAHNCLQIGFKHKSKFTEFIPQVRKVLDSDIADMKNGKPRQFLMKVSRIIEERKRYHVHLFERGSEWHCFYFTYRDMDTGKGSHWRHGSHIHYISYLWPNLKKRQVWDSFKQRDVDIQGAIHIRCEYAVIDPEVAEE